MLVFPSLFAAVFFPKTKSLGFCFLYQSEGGKAQRPNGIFDSWVSVHVGGWQGQRQGWAEQAIVVLFSQSFSLALVVLTSSNLGPAKFESRGTEGTDVIRRTRSTFW